jgi:hypothetical protein
MIPAKVIPSKNMVCVCYGGAEHVKEDFEILRQGEYVWEYAKEGEVPEGGEFFTWVTCFFLESGILDKLSFFECF